MLFEAVKLPWCCESDGFPPLLMQTTVAAYAALKFAVALVLPTPASSKEPHETLRLLLTVQLGEPVWTCVPFGALLELNVVVWLAEAVAEDAMTTASGTAKRKSIRRNTVVPS